MTVNKLNEYKNLIEERAFLIKSREKGVLSAERYRELRQINRKIGSITDFVLKCPNPLTKQIMITHFIGGNNYDKTAAIIGNGLNAKKCKTIIAEYISQ